jgi:hypothetical protein
MFYGGISSLYKTQLVVTEDVSDTINSSVYCGILKKYVFPLLRKHGLGL